MRLTYVLLRVLSWDLQALHYFTYQLGCQTCKTECRHSRKRAKTKLLGLCFCCVLQQLREYHLDLRRAHLPEVW